ncbi:MAG: glycoside hydrolase family 172 protein [Mucilaginibacter sp.]
MKKRLYLLTILLTFAAWVYGQPQNVSVATELKRLYDIRQLPQYVSGTHVWEKSSYDTTGGNDDGFSGKYSFARKNPDSTLILFEAKGKGVIDRIWMPTHNDDTLDFYFDGKEKPAFSIKYYDLFSGKVYPFISPVCGNQLGGYFCYIPIPFNNGCKIVLRAKTMQFYQIQCRTYPGDYKIKTFDINFTANERAELEKVVKLWNGENNKVKNFYNAETKVAETNALLKPGKTISLFNANQGGRIDGIEISPASAFTGLNKQVDIKITWDGEKQPAVYAPLADFFGYAYGNPSMQSLVLGSKQGINYCYIPMPFDKSAKIELIYRPLPGKSPESKTINARVYYSADKRKPATEGKFYASWFNDHRPAKGTPHVFLNIKGKGHYVGTLLQAQGLSPGMTEFFEGDDSTATDGITRLHGTGSEDYFNGGWYALLDRWDTKMSLPLHGALDYSLPFARTGGYRLYLNDKLSFSKSIFHSIEHGPEGNKIPVDYTSVALYYADAPPQTVMKPDNAHTRVYVPDTLIMYPQLMRFAFLDIKGMKEADGGFNFTAEDRGRINISLNELPAGRYKVYADMVNDKEGAEVSLWQRQTQLGEWISVNSPKKMLKQHIYLGDMSLGELKSSLTLVLKTNGDNNKLTLTRLIFEKSKVPYRPE